MREPPNGQDGAGVMYTTLRYPSVIHAPYGNSQVQTEKKHALPKKKVKEVVEALKPKQSELRFWAMFGCDHQLHIQARVAFPYKGSHIAQRGQRVFVRSLQ